MKTKRYNLEHNSGHGKANLAAMLATMNLIAFAMHTVADLVDPAWQAARAAVGTRKRFFEELRVITTYPLVPSWSRLVETPTAGKPPPAVLGGRPPVSRSPPPLPTPFLLVSPPMPPH